MPVGHPQRLLPPPVLFLMNGCYVRARIRDRLARQMSRELINKGCQNTEVEEIVHQYFFPGEDHIQLEVILY